MLSFLQAGGIWSVVITFTGLCALAAGICQFRRVGERDYGALIAGLTGLTLCVSLVGYGVGLWSAVGVSDVNQPADAAALMAMALGYASTVLALGGVMTTAALIVGSVAYHRHLNCRPVPGA
jgi:hypothetical protein